MGLEQLDEVARGIHDEGLASALPVDDVGWDVRVRGSQPRERSIEIVDLDLEAVPTAGLRSGGRHPGAPGASGSRCVQQELEVIPREHREAGGGVHLDLEPKDGRVELDRVLDVFDDVTDPNGCHLGLPHVSYTLERIRFATARKRPIVAVGGAGLVAHEDPDVDPRILRTRRIVREAVLEELASTGFGDFTVESVAARAGVGKSTIYRHWRDRTELILDALEAMNVQPDIDAAGTPRDRVEQLLAHLAEVMADPRLGACALALVEGAEREPEIAEVHHRFSTSRRLPLRQAIEEGITNGSFPPHLDPELASQALAGAVVYRRMMSGAHMAPEEVPGLIATVLGDE